MLYSDSCDSKCSIKFHWPLLYIIYYLLTYSMVQSPSWEANWFAASQEIPGILWIPKIHYCTHKRRPPVPVLCQPNPVHIPTSHFLEIHPNIIHPSTPRSPQWSLSPPRPYTPPSPHPYAPHAQPISFFSILSPAQYWVRSTDHLSIHCCTAKIWMNGGLLPLLVWF